MNSIGIYVHIPFCEGKCKYCNFVSGKYTKEIQNNYIKSVIKEIEDCNVKKQVSSVFFGGGTPSVLTAKKIEKILLTIKNKFIIKKNAEISIECNPNSITKEKLKKYLNIGFNRISFGVQSLDDSVLKLLGRLHNKDCALNAIKLAKNVGFNNINADILLGIKENKNILKDIQELKKSGTTHISAYMLILEDGTPLKDQFNQNKIKLLSDDESISQYESYLKALKKNGFNRYEISNFALKGYKCRHNINYWECGEYIGFGVAAHSYLKGVRFYNTNKIIKYLKDYNKKNYEKLIQKEKLEELIMLGLRTKQGVSLKKLKMLGYNTLENKNVLKFIALGIIKINKTHMYITSKNFGISNQIILKLLE